MASENFYYGTTYPLEPEYGDLFTGYRISAGELGASTSIQTANQIREVTNLLNQGMKQIEISPIRPDVFEMIPKQHLKEINRLSKLTGTEASVHGPMVEPSGYNEQGRWSEAERKQAENEISSSVERSHELNPDGNIPVTFHTSYVLPEEKIIMKEEGKEKPKSMLAADTRTGEIIQIKETERYFPEEGGLKKEFDPKSELKKRNEEAWIQTLNNLNWNAMRGEETVRDGIKIFKGEADTTKNQVLGAYAAQDREKILGRLVKEKKISNEEKDIYVNTFRVLDHGSILLRDSYNNLRELYNRVYKEANPEDKAKLNMFAESIKKEVEAGIEKKPEELEKFAKIMEEGVRVLKDISSPNLFQPFNKFLIDKDSETFSNVALNAYKKFGDKAPIISIENPPAGGALSRAEELKEVVERTRQDFAKKLAKEKGMSESQAKEAAEKLIGATWDTSHISMMRKYGYTEQDLIEQTKKIAPLVKHVHLNDNFGHTHTDLPPGMGSVPIKGILKELEKEGFKGKKIFEGGQWFQHFQTSPHPYVLEGMGSPLFPMKAPYWNQITSTYGSYFAFPSAYFPEQHFSLYGGGWASLPAELGGQMPGKQSRVTGTPMA